MVSITFPDRSVVQAADGVTLEQVWQDRPEPGKLPVIALVNGRQQELDYPLYTDSQVEWLDHNNAQGWRVYRRSLIFLLQLAVWQLFPQRQLWVCHSLSDCLYCRLDGPENQPLRAGEVASIETWMRQQVEAGLRYERHWLNREDAAAMFNEYGDTFKARQLQRYGSGDVPVYHALGHFDCFYGKLAVSAAYTPFFHLLPFESGFVMHLPARAYLGCAQRDGCLEKQLQATLSEYDDWSRLMGVGTADDLNRVVAAGSDAFTDLVLVAETLQERNLHHISDAIFADFPRVRLVLIAGPSSSGKTTTCRRLGIQFRTLGVRPVSISLDDYFTDRDKAPLLPNGKPDLEGLGALDVAAFQRDMLELLAGKPVSLPRYDFKTGKSVPNFRSLQLADDQILLVEGLHALNENLTAAIPAAQKRKLFLSALTTINLDPCTPLFSSDSRLMRRIVRDMQFRGFSAENTLAMWEEVRRGEHHNIFPYQEQADFFLNSTLIYEQAVLRPVLEASLGEIGKDSPYYEEARRLLRLIRYFDPAAMDPVPCHSILREFLGGSIFHA